MLLREIKDFWRVALLASVLLYPTNIDDTKDSSAEQFKLDKRSQTFKNVENAIMDLGMVDFPFPTLPASPLMLDFRLYFDIFNPIAC